MLCLNYVYPLEGFGVQRKKESVIFLVAQAWLESKRNLFRATGTLSNALGFTVEKCPTFDCPEKDGSRQWTLNP